jgi:hypothetical protein
MEGRRLPIRCGPDRSLNDEGIMLRTGEYRGVVDRADLPAGAGRTIWIDKFGRPRCLRQSRLFAVAFWCSLFLAFVSCAWLVHCGLEASRGDQRLREAKAEGQRLKAEAAKDLATAQKQLDDLLKLEIDLKAMAMRTAAVPADDSLGKTVEQYNATTAANDQARMEAYIAKQGVQAPREIDAVTPAVTKLKIAQHADADAPVNAARLLDAANSSRDRSHRLLLIALLVVAVSGFAVIGSGVGWVLSVVAR